MFTKQRSIRVAAVLCWIVEISSILAAELPGRISSQLADLGEVHKLYLAQGLASVVQLPYPITEVKLGNPDDIQAVISKTLPSEVTLILKRSTVQPTNLIIRCGVRTFVFDVIPSKKTHQDLVRISGSYGAPQMQDMGAVLIDSSRGKEAAKENAPKSSDMVLIDSSAGGHE